MEVRPAFATRTARRGVAQDALHAATSKAALKFPGSRKRTALGRGAHCFHFYMKMTNFWNGSFHFRLPGRSCKLYVFL
jgi:hypothetical protein